MNKYSKIVLNREWAALSGQKPRDTRCQDGLVCDRLSAAGGTGLGVGLSDSRLRGVLGRRCQLEAILFNWPT